MRIGELAKQTNTHIETIRFWEKQGLITPSRKGKGKYRYYSDSDIQRIRFIQGAKCSGFTLNEISELIQLEASQDEAGNAPDSVLFIARNRLYCIESKLIEMQRQKQRLRSILEMMKVKEQSLYTILEN